MNNSLLAHIAGRFNSSEYENVANSSLCYLLESYEPARIALQKLLDMNIALSHFETENATEKHGRPDITGYDQSGKKQVIIEGKFGAKLTENQPVNYLKELPAGAKCCFLRRNGDSFRWRTN